MGFLRFILAASVVAEHSTPILGLTLVGGHLAVMLFFIISGFYMALILETKYTSQPNRYWLFISNRFSRILPSYYAVLLLSVLFYIAASLYLRKPADRLAFWDEALRNGHYVQVFWVALCQFTLVGMDVVGMLVYNPALGIHWPGPDVVVDRSWLPGGPFGTAPAWRLLFVPQAWSISIELLFYLMAPWLLTWKNSRLKLLGLASGAGYFIFALMAPRLVGTFAYFFFPFQLVFFVTGILAYRYAPWILEKIRRPARSVLIGAAFVLIFLYPLVKGPMASAALFLGFFFLVPVLFEESKRVSWDRSLGELSYPIYICHILVKWVLLALMGVNKSSMLKNPPGWLLLALSVGMALLLHWFIDRRVDKWRQSRVQVPKETMTKGSRAETSKA